MQNPSSRNIGATLRSVAVAAGEAVAAGSGDNTEVTGATINRATYDWPGSAKLCIAYKTSLTDTETLGFAVEYQESDDGSNWDAAVAIQALTTAETGELTAEVGEVEYDLDLTGRKQYVRYNITPDLSAGATDTVHWAALAVLGGARSQPQTASAV